MKLSLSIDEQTKKRLAIYKYEQGLKNYCETIKSLLINEEKKQLPRKEIS